MKTIQNIILFFESDLKQGISPCQWGITLNDFDVDSRITDYAEIIVFNGQVLKNRYQ